MSAEGNVFMKKIWMSLLVVSVIACFWGCKETKDSKTPDVVKSTDAVDEKETKQPDTTKPIESQTNDSTVEEPEETSDAVAVTADQSLTVDTSCFSIRIPQEWRGKFVYEVTENENQGYYLGLYEKSSHEGMYGAGWLCSIALIATSENYMDFPSYDVLGSLKADNGEIYNVVVLYPTDVQFMEDSAEIYCDMMNQMDQVLETIEYKDACEFSETPAAVEAEQ